MDLELEEELKERENTMVEQSRVERTLHELEIKISELNREKEDKDREMERIQVADLFIAAYYCVFALSL